MHARADAIGELIDAGTLALPISGHDKLESKLS